MARTVDGGDLPFLPPRAPRHGSPPARRARSGRGGPDGGARARPRARVGVVLKAERCAASPYSAGSSSLFPPCAPYQATSSPSLADAAVGGS
jgi:hypothetical protein